MQREDVLKFYTILESYGSKKSEIQSRVESIQESKIDTMITNGKIDSTQVFYHFHSGWYLGDRNKSAYCIGNIPNLQRGLALYEKQLAGLLEDHSGYNHAAPLLKYHENPSKADINADDHHPLLAFLQKRVLEIWKDQSVSIYIGITKRISRKNYFDNRGCYIEYGDKKMEYAEIALRGGKKNLNDTIILEDEKNSIPKLNLWLDGISKRYHGMHKKLPDRIDTILLTHEAVGMLVHEVFGHPYESDWGCGQKNSSLDKLEWLNVTDHPDHEQSIRYFYDDCGVKSKPTVLIQHGRESSRLNTREAYGPISSNARAQDFRYPAITRMSNTYLEPGRDKTCQAGQIHQGLIINKLHSNIVFENNTLYLPVREAEWKVKNECYHAENELVKINLETLMGAILGEQFKINLLWCNKGGQEIVVGAGGPEILLDYGVGV